MDYNGKGFLKKRIRSEFCAFGILWLLKSLIITIIIFILLLKYNIIDTNIIGIVSLNQHGVKGKDSSSIQHLKTSLVSGMGENSKEMHSQTENDNFDLLTILDDNGNWKKISTHVKGNFNLFGINDGMRTAAFPFGFAAN